MYEVKLSEHELWALNAALLEAKFSDRPWDTDVAASPILAKLAREVVNLLRETPSYGGIDWDQWLELKPSSREWANSLKFLKEKAGWFRLSEEKQREFVSDLLSPYRVSDQTRERFLEQARKLRAPSESA